MTTGADRRKTQPRIPEDRSDPDHTDQGETMKPDIRFEAISEFLRFQLDILGSAVATEREHLVARVTELPDVYHDADKRERDGRVIGFRREEFVLLAGQALMLQRFCAEYDRTLTAAADDLIGVAYRIANGVNLAELEILFPAVFEPPATPAAGARAADLEEAA
jgi:hypothetical protein